MKIPSSSALCLMVFAGYAIAAEPGTVAPSPAKALTPWLNEVPAGCPFPQSTELTGVAFSGRHAEYTGADTWYPSWAADGNLYSPWTDGNVNGLNSGSGGENATTGHATILGDDPLKLTVTDQGVFKSNPPGWRYAMCLQEVRLLTPKDAPAPK